MELFHISCKEYKEGDIIKSSDFKITEYYKDKTAKKQNWIDDFFDADSPENAPIRRQALFAFDKMENCIAFKNECENNIYLYKVEMKEMIACPMCLIDRLEQNNEAKNTIIREEYWKPKEEWEFLEYLSDEMEIIDIISDYNVIKLRNNGKYNYEKDYDKCNKKYKK